MKRPHVALLAAAIAALLVILAWRSLREASPAPSKGVVPAGPEPVDPAVPAPPSVDPAAIPGKGTMEVLTHSGGRPIGGVKVMATREETGQQMQFESKADGRERLLGMPAGEYAVDVRHPGFFAAMKHATVKEGETVAVSIDLKEGGRLRGLVTDREGSPVAGAVVNLLHPETQRLDQLHLVTKTDAEGRFRVDTVPLREVGLLVRHGRFKPWTQLGLAFRTPGETHEVHATLQPGTVLAGRVVDAAGSPVGGATVRGEDEKDASTRTGADGRFTLGGSGDPPLALLASARLHGTVHVPVLSAAEEIQVRLPKAESVQVRVEAKPLPAMITTWLVLHDAVLGRDVRVYVRSHFSRGEETLTLPDVAPGTYRLEVEAHGHEAEERPRIEVRPGVSTETRVRLLKKP